MTARSETHLLSGAHVLHATTPEEDAAVESAMHESEELRNEIVGLADTAVALGLAVPAAAPPAALRASLLEAIERTPQLAAEDEPDPETEEPHPAPVRHLVPRRRPRVLRRPRTLLAAAAVAVLLFGGGVLVQRALVGPELQYSAIVAAGDVQPAVVSVRGGGEATVYSSREEGGSAIVLKGVSVPAGRVLQVWRMQDGRVVSAGLYEAGAHYRVIDAPPAAGESIAVSVEPAGGSQQPTTRPIVQVPLSA